MNTRSYLQSYRLVCIFVAFVFVVFDGQELKAEPAKHNTQVLPASAFVSGWTLLEGTEAQKRIDALDKLADEDRLARPNWIEQVWQRPLACITGASVIELIDRNGHCYVILESARERVLMSTGDVDRLIEFANDNGLVLNKDTVSEYLILMFSLSDTPDGRLQIIEVDIQPWNLDDIELRESLNSVTPPVFVVESDDGIIIDCATLFEREFSRLLVEVNYEGILVDLEVMDTSEIIETSPDRLIEGAFVSDAQPGKSASAITQHVRGGDYVGDFISLLINEPDLEVTRVKLKQGTLESSTLKKIDIKASVTSEDLGFRGSGGFGVYAIEFEVPTNQFNGATTMSWLGISPDMTGMGAVQSWYLAPVGAQPENYFRKFGQVQIRKQDVEYILSGVDLDYKFIRSKAGQDDPNELIVQSTDFALDPGVYRLWFLVDFNSDYLGPMPSELPMVFDAYFE